MIAFKKSYGTNLKLKAFKEYKISYDSSLISYTRIYINFYLLIWSYRHNCLSSP